MKTNPPTSVLLTWLLLAAAGCQQQPKYTLSGEVRVASVTPDNGSIAIESQSGGPTLGSALERGKFRIENVPEGKARVRFVVHKIVGKEKPTPDAPAFDKIVDLLPTRYRHGVMIDVSEDRLDLVFNLDENLTTPQ